MPASRMDAGKIQSTHGTAGRIKLNARGEGTGPTFSDSQEAYDSIAEQKENQQ
jgi:ribosomal 30S subunit maturation factor RimM